MNKLYTLTLTVFFSAITFAQNGTNKGFENLKPQLSSYSDINKVITSQSQQNKKVVGDTIWSEDFTNGFPAGWSSVDNTGNGYEWVLNSGNIWNSATSTVVPPGYTNATAIASESGGNYMLLFGDEYNRVQLANTGTSVELNAYFQTSAIPLSGQSAVTVNFQQKFRRCCANTGISVNLIVSTDPTFTTNTQSYDIVGGVSTSVGSGDPMNMAINISAFAGGINGDIYLRFHHESGATHYFWMIDDISITETGINDIETSNGFYGFNGYQYTSIPQSQIQPMDFSLVSSNIGSADQPGTFFSVDIDQGGLIVFHATSNDTTINSLSTDTFHLNGIWTPPSTPLYSLYTPTLCIYSDSVDETPYNNCDGFYPFQITSNLLALDDFSTTPGNGGGNPAPGGSTEYEAGNQFKIVNQDEDLYAIDIVTGGNTPVGTFIDAVIYQIDFTTSPESYTEIWRSTSYSITASDIGTAHHFYDTPGTPIATLIAGEVYFAAVHSYFDYEYGTSGTNPVAGTPAARHSSIRYPNMGNATTSFGLTNTPMIRLNFDDLVGIDDDIDKANSFSISPNPTSGKFTIAFDSAEQDNYILSIKNVIGQTLIEEKLNITEGSKEEISLSDYEKGIYFISLTNKKGTTTNKLIVE
jgi:hypothetical protein